MQLTASDIITLHRPTPCDLRVHLREQGIPEVEPSAFEQVLQTLGQRHEEEHLDTLGAYEDPSLVPPEERVQRTSEAIRDRAPVIYQGELAKDTVLNGIPVTLIGRPDFLIWDNDGYLIRDSKLSRQVDEKHHVEIALQLQLYGWLFERTAGVLARRLEVHTGKGDVVDVRYDGGFAALAELAKILELKRLGAEPYEPVGWTKCGGCGYHDHCWQKAEAEHDVSLVMDVDQGLARALNALGTRTAADLLANFDLNTLSGLKRPWGKGEQKVGKRAEKILLYAEVVCSGQERILAPPSIPIHENYVMFDLEGMPPNLDDLDKIYLWGMQVYGKRPSPFLGVTAAFGADGDREGWFDFLRAAKKIFDEYGDIKFVHWHQYEPWPSSRLISERGFPNDAANALLSV
jgi:predicted RecB family nuclease